MHSSRMRTGRTLTIFRSLLFRGGGCLVPRGCLVPGAGGVPAWSRGGFWSWGVPAWSGGYLPGPGGCLVWGCLVPGVSSPGGVSGPGGTYLVWGGVPSWSQRVPAWSGGVSGPGGVPAWSGGGCLVPGGYLPGPGVVYLPGPRGVYLPGRGGVWLGTPPVDRMTHACENITLAKTSFRPVKISHRSPLQGQIQDFPEGAPTPIGGANILFGQNFLKTERK